MAYCDRNHRTIFGVILHKISWANSIPLVLLSLATRTETFGSHNFRVTKKDLRDLCNSLVFSVALDVHNSEISGFGISNKKLPRKRY